MYIYFIFQITNNHYLDDVHVNIVRTVRTKMTLNPESIYRYPIKFELLSLVSQSLIINQHYKNFSAFLATIDIG